MADKMGEKIRILRRSLGMNQTAFARWLGVQQGSISNYESGKRAPDASTLISLASATNDRKLKSFFLRRARLGPAQIELLMGVEAPERPSPTAAGSRARLLARVRELEEQLRRARRKLPEPLRELQVVVPTESRARFESLEGAEQYVPVPLLKDAAAAGEPREIAESDVEGYAVIYEAWCKNPANFTCVHVRGDSMAPILHDGYIVAIDHSQRDPGRLRGKMVAARVPGPAGGAGVTIKWLHVDPERNLILVPENHRQHAPIVIPRGEANPIVGAVSWWWGRQR